MTFSYQIYLKMELIKSKPTIKHYFQLTLKNIVWDDIYRHVKRLVQECAL
jgi:hypothetical protein